MPTTACRFEFTAKEVSSTGVATVEGCAGFEFKEAIDHINLAAVKRAIISRHFKENSAFLLDLEITSAYKRIYAGADCECWAGLEFNKEG